jgi:hypothetical protein
MFLPRIEFPSVDSYRDAAISGALRPGQYVAFEGVKARFARANGAHVTTFYGKTGARKEARAYLRKHGKRAAHGQAH